MSKTGSSGLPGTAEGAALGRALHTAHARNPVLADDWAQWLLSETDRERVQREPGTTGMHAIEGFDASPVFAVNLGCVRYAEDAVERAVRGGATQLLLLGAGFDTLALRRDDLAPGLAVFEVDHPDVQALKRARIEATGRRPAMAARYVPVDFERDRLGPALIAAGFDAGRRTAVTWMNTVPYLSESAIRSSLAELAGLLAPDSTLVLNYAPEVNLTAEQLEFVTGLLAVTSSLGESLADRWKPAAFESLLDEFGFRVGEHLDEEALTLRYFEDRADGLRPGIPLRVLSASRTAAEAG